MRFLLLLAVTLPLRLAAADFCAVYLTIIDSYGKPADAPIDLIDQGGHVEKSVVAHGKASLCDMEFGPHTIRIGDAHCSGYVTIHDISLVYGLPRTITAVWDGCRTGTDLMTLPPSCQVSFRVTSTEGKKLRGAEVAKEGDPGIYHTDGYGRVFLAVANGSVKDFTFSAPGYADKTIRVPCQRYETIEKVVPMTVK
jgi:hypothetical protein